MIGVTIKEKIGVGDAVQFSSLPENYFRATGERMVDVSKHWIYDFNPFVVRDAEPVKTFELWNFGPQQREWPRPRPHVYLSNAEIHASAFGVKNPTLNRPRLYRFESFPFEARRKIYLQTVGKSNGEMPEQVVRFILDKYGPTGNLWHIGPIGTDYGLRHVETPTLWDLAFELSQARMFIGPDSGPSWIAACYPDVVIKKFRLRQVWGQHELKDWVPLEIDNFHAHWDDRFFQIFNATDDDVGFTSSYKKV